MKKCIVCLVLLILLFGCVGEKITEQNTTSPHENATGKNQPDIEKKETIFTNLSDQDFSIEYPDWEQANGSNASILSLHKGACMLNVDRHNASISPLFSWIVNLTLNNENVTLLDFDSGNYSMSVQAPYNNITFRANYVMRYCNYETYIIGATCAEGYQEAVENDTSLFLSSARCANEYEEPNYSSTYTLPSLENTTYSTFIDEDYSVNVPDWSKGEINAEEGILAYTRNTCTVALNKYNAPSENLFSWIENYIENNDSITLVHKNVPEKDITYDLALENVSLRVRMRAVYCNYQSYNMITMCEKNYFENNSNVLDSIVSSGICAKDYSFTPEIKDIEVPPPPEEKKIVETNVGEEYGINAENVVIFFNSNSIFEKVMKKYEKVNLRISDEEKGVDIQLRAMLENGKITNVKEGAYPDAAFTLMMPLNDALNLFNNADKVTLGNFLSFIVNVKTDPPSMMKTLIADAFKP
jgi:hypothetical protein